LIKNEIQCLLVIGFDCVAIAKSAKNAGYKIYCADYFGDVDLQYFSDGYKAVIKQKVGRSCGKIEQKFNPESFVKIAKSLLKKYRVDAILLSSGLDDYFSVIHELNDLTPIIGNLPQVIEKVRRKSEFFEELKHLSIAYPQTKIVQAFDEARSAATEIGYPVVLKPTLSSSGMGIKMAHNVKELTEVFPKVLRVDKEVLIQEFIGGIHVSVSILATEENVKLLTINEQLLGLNSVFQREPFGYCGNIVPLQVTPSVLEKCKFIAEKIALHFGLKGSNGIDLVIYKDTPYVIEVNPRFQGTLECVENVLRINMVKLHLNACLHNSIPIMEEKPQKFCTRLILYAPKRIIASDLTVFQEVRDIPLPLSIIEKGEPLCSILTEANSGKMAFRKANRLAEVIYTRILQLKEPNPFFEPHKLLGVL